MLQEQEIHLKWNNIQRLLFPFVWLKYIHQTISSSEYKHQMHTKFLDAMFAFTSISQGCTWRCHGWRNSANWWWPQLLLVTDVLNLPELFLDQKWYIKDQLDSEDNTCGPVLLAPSQKLSSSNQWAATFLKIFFFKSISRGVRLDSFS